MKKLYTLALLMISVAFFAQGSDSFSYTRALKDNGWGSHSGTAGQVITVAGSLTYSGMTSQGNKVQTVAGNTEDVNFPSVAPLTGTAYYSALLSVPNVAGFSANTGTGNYLLMFGALSSTVPPTYTTFNGRLYIKTGATATTFNLGILNGSGGAPAPTYSATDYSINTTYLVVVKFDFTTNTSSLFVNPTLGTTEGTATVSNATGTAAAPAQIDGFIIREAGTANAGTGDVEIDEVKLGSTWASVAQGTTTTPTTPDPIAAAQNFCNAASVANLVATGITGATLSWFDVATGGTALLGTDALSTATYYVSQTTPESTTELGSGFASPFGVAVQSDGKILVADTNNNVVNQMNADGTGIVALGSGFFHPFGVAVQADGKILIADTNNNAIKRMDADGTNIETLGSGFNFPTSVAVQADGKILVADYNNNAIKRMNADGTNIEILGNGFATPSGIAVQADGKILVSDSSNNISRMNADGTGIVTLGSGFNNPIGIAVQADGKILVCDYNNNAIKRMNADGTSIETLGTGLSSPYGLAIQSDGGVLVADSGNNAIKKITPSGTSNRVSVAVTINVTPAPTATALTFCGTNPKTVANLSATGTALKWYADNTTATALSSTDAIATGTYFVSQTLNACESTRTAVDVTVNITPAPAATAQTFCGTKTVADLVATGTLLRWYSNNGATTALLPTAAISTGNYYVSQSINGCRGTRTQVAVTVNNTVAPTATAQTFCGSKTVADLVATGTALNWYTDNTTTTALASTDAIATGTYYVSQTLNACESTRTSVAVAVNVTPPPAATAQTFCGTKTVADLVAIGTLLRWYSNNGVTTALLPTAAILTGNYYVSQSINGCRGTRTQVAVTVNNTVAPTATAQTFCGSKTVADLVATGTALNWYTDNTTTTALSSTAAIATGIYYVSQTLNACESTRTSVAVTVNVTPMFTPAEVADISTCNSYTLPALSISGAKYYTAPNGPSGGGAEIILPTTYTSNATVYPYAETGTTPNCFVSESIDIQVYNVVELADVFSCDSFTLPALADPNARYYHISGSIGLIPAGATLTASQTVYVSGTGPSGCTDESDFYVTLLQTPIISPIAPVFVCDSYFIPQYNAPLFYSTNPITKLYKNPGGPANNPLPTDEYLPGEVINNFGTTPLVVTIYAYSAVGSAPCYADEPFVVTIYHTPVIAPAEVLDVIACNAYTLPALTVGNYFSDAAHTQPITNLVLTVTSAVYVYAENPSAANCTAIESFVVNIVNTPIAPTGAALQTFTVTSPADATIANLVVAPSNVIWYASLTDAQTGTNPLQSTTVLTSFATYYAVNNENGCPSAPFAVTAEVITVLGADTFESLSFKYYPNPTSGVLNISYANLISEVNVLNVLGQVVLNKKTNASEIQIDLTSFPSATYLVKIIADGKSKTFKIMKGL